ncbi:hypothetical protein SAMN05216382_2689 [Sphingomonas palmae]|uniref:Phage integrase family protein n=1 Tax=Sphingomonas palmae TaxID=1855283 RepID=A0A1H7T809_9SPHN|nr:hypothetical protein [Sphingomonas palmae]SEL80645.1 hypothetical protein SAMN05216382_2689 [Sphingomonas palmae]
MKTEQIIARQRRTGVHPRDASPDGCVSTTSGWADETWFLDPHRPGSRPSDFSITWDPSTSPTVTECLKALLWSLLVSRPKGKPLALGRAVGLYPRLRYLGRWMDYRRHSGFGTLSSVAIQVYRQDLVKYLGNGNDDEKPEVDVETGAVASYLYPLRDAYEQAHQLRAAGVEPIRIDPFAGSSAWAVAEDIVPQVEGFTPPLPDEIVLPVVHAVNRFIGTPAEDILRLQDLCLRQQRPDRAHVSNWEAIIRELRSFTFGTPKGEIEAWHPPFSEFLKRRDQPESAEQDEEDGEDEGDREVYGTNRVRRLIYDLAAACVILLRFQTGVRHGEILTFEPGLGDDGLPTCVTVEQSLSGAYDLFFVHGVVSKGWEHPTDTRWLLAGRVAGDERLPDAVRALQILNQLFGPWRVRSGREDTRGALLLMLGTGGLPSDASGVLPMHTDQLAMIMKAFVERNVSFAHLDPTDERLRNYVTSRGRAIQSRQWRKTWANWMIRVDKRLLTAISQQFHHNSIVLTQDAYIGKDAMQLGLVESAAMERAVRYMRRAMEGEDHVGGGLRKVVDADLTELRLRIAGLEESVRDYEIRTWLLERDVRIWFSPHGKCFIGLLPTDSRCHEVAGTADWANQAPAFAHRTPQLCSGCPCFAVDEDDLPFWAERYLENRDIWNAAVRRHMEADYTVARERSEQSGKILRSLGVEPSTLHHEVTHAEGR